MLDQLFGLLLFGLGLSGPSSSPSVKGDSDTIKTEIQSTKDRESSSDASLKAEPSKDKERKIKMREDELKNIFEVRKERLHEELKTRREEAVEKFKEEREAFKEKVSQIRDTKKKK